MGFKKIIDKIEDKIEQYEDEMDEDEIPPWYGKKEESSTDTETESSDTVSESKSDSFNLDKTGSETEIEIALPGVPEDAIDINLENSDNLYIEVSESGTVEDRTYEYTLSENEDPNSIDVTYSNGLLTVSIGNN